MIMYIFQFPTNFYRNNQFLSANFFMPMVMNAAHTANQH